MKPKKLVRAACAAAMLAVSGAAYGDDVALHVVYCKATIMGGGEEFVSVTLPPTDGYYDNEGNPLTYWNVGNVQRGGVADSWHGEGGPGRFTARNTGNVGAYLYVTTGSWYDLFGHGDSYNPFYDSENNRNRVDERTFGGELYRLNSPAISPSELYRWNNYVSYHLAFTTDTMAKVPTWHSLNRRWHGDEWYTEESPNLSSSLTFGYMGYVAAGDYLTFDLKFWSSPDAVNGQGYLFTFGVEASSFPLWDHGMAAE